MRLRRKFPGLKTILITGCSWSAGVWGKDSNDHYGLLDSGLAGLYVENGFDVVNLSCPGGDPWGLLAPLDNFLWTNPHRKIDHIYYFQTDIGRSFAHQELPIERFNYDFDLAINFMYYKLYERLNEIAQQRRVKIKVIGGLTDVTVPFRLFGSLELVVPSWCQLIDPELPLVKIVDPMSLCWLTDRFSSRKSQLLSLLEQGTGRLDYMKNNKKWFWPDGGHPNTRAHEKLFDYLIKHVQT